MAGPEHTYTCDQCGKRAPSEYLPQRGELQPWKLPKDWPTLDMGRFAPSYEFCSQECLGDYVAESRKAVG